MASLLRRPTIHFLQIVATTLQSSIICCNSSGTFQVLEIRHCVLKCWDLFMQLHGATSQKTEFMIVIMLLRCVENSVCDVKCHL